MNKVKIACVQAPVVYGSPAQNAEFCACSIQDLASEGVQIIAFPEAFLTGYCTPGPDAARAIAIPFDHPTIADIDRAVQQCGVVAVVGFIESDGDRLFNSAAVFESGKPVQRYRKTHIPFMGVDRFVEPGEDLPVFDTAFGRLGVLICYDLRAPEATRTLALQGADLILLPTNWPEGAECSADHIAIARAAENRVYLAACNRAGEEHGFRFIGRSKIIDPVGNILAFAGDEPTHITAEIDLESARTKRTVNIPGEYEIDVFASRRPELYREIVKPISSSGA